MSFTSLTLVIDDNDVHFNISRDDVMSPGPSSQSEASLDLARKSAWGNSLTVITAPSVGFWQNVTGYSRVAVYGSLLPPTALNQTAWAIYTIGGNSTAGNLTSAANVITDYPLFTSGELDPGQQYNLTVEVSASADAPYLLDYVLAYQFADATPILSSSSSFKSSSASPTAATSSATGTGSSGSSISRLDRKFIYIVVGLGAGVVLLFILMCLLLRRICCGGSRKPKSIEAPAAPEPPFPPRPQPTTVSSTAKLSQRSASVTMGTVTPASASVPTLVSPSSPPVPVPVSPAALATSLPIAAVSRTLSAPTSMPPHVRREVERAASQSSPRTGSLSQAQVSSGMVPPTMVPNVEPFAAPAVETTRPLELYNPYDSLLTVAEVPVTASSTMRSNAVPSAPSESASSASTTSRAQGAPTAPTVATSAAIPATAAIAEPAMPSQGPSTVSLVLGPNGYPKEKQEVRMEPPEQKRLYSVNADIQGSSSQPPVEGPSDAPPAYGV
ncbi:hypothetical protein L226DRAFT_573577 [Lentinus tigrinus ALCF2SS1-7]|uniref:Mid2 domain-containing protein n=1 Tax=Lentinus tigrinus ALCF2SS1-6 TaxID=1328759 RepID=A0A5C2S2R0_9APHY|nr:hypothetical protein L227DRAFT_613420 [Lentinus tigrinus ALCF2SS1-6]RPD71907.1 hypothetical protein L226DRAFT_573577 [Lentinus tigrinus ALCF2SS1-7]